MVGQSVHAFHKAISPKVNIIVWVEFKFAHFEAAVQYFSNYVTGISLTLSRKIQICQICFHCYWKSSSLLNNTDNMHPLDYFSLRVPIGRHTWQYSRWHPGYERNYENKFCWSAKIGVSMCSSPYENVAYELVHTSPAVFSYGGARGVVVIAVGNGHGDTSSNPGRDWLHFT